MGYHQDNNITELVTEAIDGKSLEVCKFTSRYSNSCSAPILDTLVAYGNLRELWLSQIELPLERLRMISQLSTLHTLVIDRGASGRSSVPIELANVICKNTLPLLKNF